MKGVLLAGGKGVRMGVQTQFQNKHLLPVYSEQQGSIPMIWYSLYTLTKSGCNDILIISSQEHCGKIIEFLGDGHQFGINLTYKIQNHNNPNHPIGIASAMRLIEGWIFNEPFAVILGDNFYEDGFAADFNNFQTNNSFAHVFLKPVDDPERFGVATVDFNNQITKIIEKPINPESNLVVTGLYLYRPHVFEILPTLTTSNRGELEISDVNEWYVQNKLISSSIINGFWSDMGTPPSMLRTIKYIDQSKYLIKW
jgi:glucose-1-phosphate thymidylyltransferase